MEETPQLYGHNLASQTYLKQFPQHNDYECHIRQFDDGRQNNYDDIHKLTGLALDFRLKLCGSDIQMNSGVVQLERLSGQVLAGHF